MSYEKFFSHPVVFEMFFNNLDFYDEVHSTDYDYRRFARHRWNAQTIVKFLAFGVRIGVKKRMTIVQTPDDYLALQTKEIKRYGGHSKHSFFFDHTGSRLRR